MYIKYLSMLNPVHWIKGFLPLILLVAAFFIQGIAVDLMQSYIVPELAKTMDVFKVSMGKENEEFAKALANSGGIKNHVRYDYSSALQNDFFRSQRNSLEVIIRKESTDNAKTTSDAPVSVQEEELPPIPQNRLTTVFIGSSRRYAVIDDKIIKIGDKVNESETLKAIEPGRVLLDGKWGARWLYVNY